MGKKYYGTCYRILREWQPCFGYIYVGEVFSYVDDWVPGYWLDCIPQYGRSEGHVIWNFVWGDPCE